MERGLIFIARIREKAIESYVTPAPATTHTRALVLPQRITNSLFPTSTYFRLLILLLIRLFEICIFLLSSPHTGTVVSSPILGYLFCSQLPEQGEKVIPLPQSPMLPPP